MKKVLGLILLMCLTACQSELSAEEVSYSNVDDSVKELSNQKDENEFVHVFSRDGRAEYILIFSKREVELKLEQKGDTLTFLIEEGATRASNQTEPTFFKIHTPEEYDVIVMKRNANEIGINSVTGY